MRFVAILTVKNEGAFLLEWLAHHRAVGFSDVLVLSNDCDDGTDRMLDRLQDMGWLTHVRNDGPHDKGPQWSALKRADSHPLVAAADWILFFDIDEFVNIHVGDHTLPALLAALPEATAITLTWRLFGNCGVVSYADRPVVDQFTRAIPRVFHWPWRAALFKTLFRNDGTYGKLGVHRPRQPDRDRMAEARWFDGSGQRLGGAFETQRIFSDYGRDMYALAQLNHYPLGSMESYIVKCDRGRANRDSGAFDMSYWVERNFCAEEDLSIRALTPARDTFLAELMADPVLAQLHRAAVAWRRQRFATLMAQDDWRSLFGRLLMTPPSQALTRNQAQLITAHRTAADSPGLQK